MAELLYDGRSESDLESLLGVPRVALCDVVTSTLDVAHVLGAEGAPAGTLIVAEQQTAGRGRAGRRWASRPGSGIWLTILERPGDPATVELLSIRLGLAAARVLDRWAPAVVRLKWPNDLYVEEGKLAGILVETRWRDQRLDWAALGMGINVVAPSDVDRAVSALRPGTDRVAVLSALVPALREAAATSGPLEERELESFAARDMARGRRCTAPVPGVVQGIDAHGSLLVGTAAGDLSFRSGSLVLEEEQ
ncbi:MAG TPA: biotin--[acetyl-CoA-carboxylase] ligase [Gemmatimonadaceae bacterium]|nr:biotin--[acetyl-CoA-carboxylase] ligase [Gemmatimonadaceae bacterium]